MKYVLRRRVPEFSRVLIVESGTRQVLENFLANFYNEQMVVDLVTCYAGTPACFREKQGSVYRVTDYAGKSGRKGLYRKLDANGYTILCMICSGEPIMTKWKWVLALRLPVKVLIINENGDYFWLDRGHRQQVKQFIAFRSGLSGGDAVSTVLRLAAFPVALLYLLWFAGTVHLLRKLQAGRGAAGG